jgi:hypothetical protein
MQAEISKIPTVILPILRGANGNYNPPLYKATYAHSDYRTFNATFNKFRILIQEEVKSIPISMHEQVNGAKYNDHFLFPTCNGKLCLAAIWPTYYLKDDSIRKTASAETIKKIEDERSAVKQNTEYYNIGELLFELEGNPGSSIFAGKVLVVGNFQEDVHVTPVGKMAGPILLANIYLSLLNGEHFMSTWLLVLLLLALSSLSYIAIFEKMPEINMSFKFLFSSYLSKFIKGYVSYFGSMFFISLLALLFFNVQVAFFLPSLIFTSIEYIKEKKYLELKK